MRILNVYVVGGVVLLGYAATASAGQKFDRLIIFGQSNVDTGNMYHLYGVPPSPPYFEGRWSNGPLWVDHVADGLGLPRPVPSRLGGTNYGHGGSTSGPGLSTLDPTSGYEIPNTGAMVDEFLASAASDDLDRTDLIIYGFPGYNDLTVGFTPEQTASNIADEFRRLYDAGARNFLIPTLLEVNPAYQEMNSRTIRKLIWEMEPTLPGMDIGVLNWGVIGFSEILPNPAAFGFTVDLGLPACRDCGNGSRPTPIPMDIVPNPEGYFTWDPAGHHSARTHEILGERALQVIQTIGVPEPRTIALAAVGAVCWIASRRQLLGKRRHA